MKSPIAFERPIRKGDKVLLEYRKELLVGKVLSADYKADKYCIRAKHSQFHTVVCVRKRFQIERNEDPELENVIYNVQRADTCQHLYDDDYDYTQDPDYDLTIAERMALGLDHVYTSDLILS